MLCMISLLKICIVRQHKTSDFHLHIDMITDELEGERDVLNGTVEALKSRV